MKTWTASRSTSNIKFVDFDNMSLSRHAPPICVGENWHYQCFLTWPTPRSVRLHLLHHADSGAGQPLH